MNDKNAGLLLLLITVLTLFMKNGFHSSLHNFVGLNRIKIKLEKDFSVDSAIFSSLNITNKIGDKIPAKSAKHILIATSVRSGSTFLGELISQHPGSFYFYEPLHYYSYISDRATVQPRVDFVSSLFEVNKIPTFPVSVTL